MCGVEGVGDADELLVLGLADGREFGAGLRVRFAESILPRCRLIPRVATAAESGVRSEVSSCRGLGVFPEAVEGLELWTPTELVSDW